jgi:hypothetical protein
LTRQAAFGRVHSATILINVKTKERNRTSCSRTDKHILTTGSQFVSLFWRNSIYFFTGTTVPDRGDLTGKEPTIQNTTVVRAV